ncbi:DUF2306 domain-containing protein [Psychrobacillus lasiicapitis]|uniref:DUF2306 domain-containing protein n=1 Tax=Psychrobacillus lasiicapitis TaxID=1636719 RepID=A0A544TCJ8_9BACI|nr:DUF2306 domain-containing protein [Psychrobacillus lasiicapitis]TQR15119.1 DUF2306 domain-containing protein [Psychrobacillus lasiicapitis]GGA22608.1 hypothetical protein GCM10011384_10230 [Psychrobacillus lasiicapitis]
MNKISGYIFTFLAIGVAGYAVVQYFIIGVDHAGLVQMKLMSLSKLSTFWYVMLFIHIAGSIVALAIGPFTLSATFREKSIIRHKRIGKLYMLGILFGGISGLYLAFYATGGLAGKLGFGSLSVFWLVSAYQALARIKANRVNDHQQWMIRNYSLTFAAVTLRIWLPLFMLVLGLERFELSYAIIAWLAWIPNIVIAELYIQRRLIKKQVSTLPAHPTVVE